MIVPNQIRGRLFAPPSLVLLAFTFVVGLLGAPSAQAAETFNVDIRVISASPGAGAKVVDPRLKALKKDLLSLPFREFKLKEQHAVKVAKGKRVDFEIPGSKRKGRFLTLTAHGVQRGGKLRFQLTIDDLKFDTLIAVPDRGTIFVGGPRSGRDTLLFAVSARKADRSASAANGGRRR